MGEACLASTGVEADVGATLAFGPVYPRRMFARCMPTVFASPDSHASSPSGEPYLAPAGDEADLRANLRKHLHRKGFEQEFG